MLVGPRESAVMREGDLVLMYEKFDKTHPVYLRQGEIFNNRFGSFHHADMIGQPYGAKIKARKGSGWMYALAPTPELWTHGVDHRTQILYIADIALVTMFLELRPGSVVIESGTGSGSLSTSLARAIAPDGHLHTFEFNEARQKRAVEDFKKNKIDHLITSLHRDVCRDGFQMTDAADAVFLDLPSPWGVVPSAKQALRSSGMICSFSPCIEQVQRTCVALEEHGFEEIRTMEILLRTHEVRNHSFEIPDFGGGKKAAAAAAGAETSASAGAEAEAGEPPRKRRREAGDGGEEEAAAEGQAEEAAGAEAGAEAAEGTGAADEPMGDPAAPAEAEPAAAAAAAAAAAKETRGKGRGRGRGPSAPCAVSRPYAEMRGHTGYVTFARKPLPEDDKSAPVPPSATGSGPGPAAEAGGQAPP
eukprot:tig00021531_g22178.t1